MKKTILLAVLLNAYFIGSTQTKNFIDQPYIEVTGKADTLVTPDEIYIRILLSEKDTKDRTSLEELEQKMVSSLKALGINIENDLTARDISSNFRYYLFRGKDMIRTKIYLLKVGDGVTASKVFIGLEETGISNASIDHVDHSKMYAFKNIMRSKAIADARASALAFTQPLAQTLGPAIHITETEGYNQLLQGKAPGIMIRGAASINGFDNNLPDIDFEKIKISSTVQVSFILK